MNNTRIAVAAALAAAATLALPGIAGTVTGLTTFTANTPAKASEVNGNFTVVKTAVDDNQAQITALNARVAALEAQLTNITALNAYLSLKTINGHATVQVSAANLQVVNGEGNTDKVNGLGNLIVGYDENRPEGAAMTCSLLASGSLVQEANCLAAGGVFAVDHKTGSHNLVLGRGNNYSSFSGAVFGSHNASSDAYASVLGGERNNASAPYSLITAGRLNDARAIWSTILGGEASDATGDFGLVAGGIGNSAEGSYSATFGGAANRATGYSSTVTGGIRNMASGADSSVSGGQARTAPNTFNWVGGSLSAPQ